MTTKQTVTYSLPLLPIFFVLLVLKMFGIISIGWFWVFFPLIIYPLFIIIFLGFIVFAALIAAFLSLFM